MGTQSKRSWTNDLAMGDHGLRMLRNGSVRRFAIPDEGMVIGPGNSMAGLRGPMLWSVRDGANGLHVLHALIPHASCLAVPVLGLVGDSFGPHADPPHLGRIEGRSYYKLDACASPDDGKVVLSMPAAASPVHLAQHEAWHIAEHTLLTDDEVRAVGFAHARAMTFLGYGQMLCEPDPREWGAHAFAHWADLHTYSAGQFTAPAGLQDIFYALLMGEIGKRSPYPSDRESHVRRLADAGREWRKAFREGKQLDRPDTA